MNAILEFIITACYCIIVSYVLKKYELNKSEKIKKHKWLWIIFVGIVYGLFGIMASEYGRFTLENGGDSALTVCAVTIPCYFFEGESGIIAAIIMAVGKIVSVRELNSVTGTATIISFIIISIFGYIGKKIFFKEKTPNILSSGIGVVGGTTLVMTLVLFDNWSNLLTGYERIKLDAHLMVAVNLDFMILLTIILNQTIKNYNKKNEKNNNNNNKTFLNYKLREEERKEIIKAKKSKIKFLLPTIFIVTFFITSVMSYFFITRVVKATITEVHIIEQTKALSETLEHFENDLEDHEIKNDDINDIINYINTWHTPGFNVMLLDNNYNLIKTENDDENKNENENNYNDLIMQGNPQEVFTSYINGKESLIIFENYKNYKIVIYSTYDSFLEGTYIVEYSLIYTLIFILTFTFIIQMILIRYFVLKNITKINRALREAKIDGSENVKVDANDTPEFVYLSDSINNTFSKLRDYIRKEKRQYNEDMNIARTIQYNMVPHIYPAYPDKPEIDIYGNNAMSSLVGGDYYDFTLTSDNELAIAISDVSGSGIPASLYMMNAKAVLHSLVEAGLKPKEIMEKLNNEIFKTNVNKMFLTGWLGLINRKTETLTYVNAAHCPALIRHGNGNFEYLKDESDVVVGFFKDVSYTEHIVPFKKGDTLILYTDGVTETHNKNNELYGYERLLRAANEVKDYDCRQIAQYIKLDTEIFADGREQFDDTTILAVKYNDDETVEYNRKIASQFESVLGEKVLHLVPSKSNQAFVEELLDKSFSMINISKKDKSDLSIAVDEIYSNVYKYAYKNKAGFLNIRLTINEKSQTVNVRFEDEGVPFNPLSVAEPESYDIGSKNNKVGGLGIYMVRKMMDDVEYIYEDNMNILTLTKKYRSEN